MMSYNKRKIVSDESEDDNFKYQCSSLQVNLSNDTDLMDSGNGSPWKTEFMNRKKTNKLQINRRLLRSKNGKKNSQSDFEDSELRITNNNTNDTNKYAINNNEKPFCIKEGIQLKKLSINLDDISIKEKVLETSCKHLKDAILFKTKEMFDEQNELSIKTAKVLKSEKSHCINSTRELKDDAENKSVMLDGTINLKNETMIENKQYIMHNQQKQDGYSNIIATPTSTNRQNSKRTMNRSRLSQKRLFVETGRQKCRIIKNIVLEKKFLLLSLRQPDPSNSPILSSNNRRLSLSKTKSHLQNQFENHNSSAVQCDQSINIEAPIVCSTFIEDNGIDGKKKAVYEVDADKDTSYTTHTTNMAVSMEMTEINGGIRMNQVTFLQNQNPDINNYIENDTKKDSEKDLTKNKNATVQELENDIHVNKQKTNDVNKLAKNNIAYPYSININDIANDQDIENNIDTYTYIPMQSSIKEIGVNSKSHDISEMSEHNSDITENQDERQCMILSNSDNTIRSSLNVNTSLDIMITADKTRNSQKSNECGIIDTIQNSTTNNKNFSIVLKSQCKTIDSVQTSLQMNTSVDSIHKTWRKKNNLSELSVQDKNIDDSERNDSNINSRYLSAGNKEENIDSLENISLIERLRNISTRNQISETNNKRKITDIRSHNIIDIKYQNYEHMNTSGDNYVEGTPYPISRSILLKSQLKHKTQNLGNNATSNSDDANSVVIEKDGNKIKLNTS